MRPAQIDLINPVFKLQRELGNVEKRRVVSPSLQPSLMLPDFVFEDIYRSEFRL